MVPDGDLCHWAGRWVQYGAGGRRDQIVMADGISTVPAADGIRSSWQTDQYGVGVIQDQIVMADGIRIAPAADGIRMARRLWRQGSGRRGGEPWEQEKSTGRRTGLNSKDC